MPVLPIDSDIQGAHFGTVEMRSIFSDSAYLQSMLDVEAALTRAEAKLGLVPAEVADAITAAARIDNLNLQRIAESTRKVGYTVVDWSGNWATPPEPKPHATSISARQLRTSSTQRPYCRFDRRPRCSAAT